MPSPSPPPPATMRAWIRPSRGPVATHLHLSTSSPTPSAPTAAGSSEVLIRVSFVALTFSSQLLLNALPALPWSRPYIPELEFSGTVVSAGSTARSQLRPPGTRVLGFRRIPDILMGRGVLAEWVRLPVGQVAEVPDGMAMAEAAGLVGCGSTAMKMLRTAGVRAGDRVLVNGASGSVGSVLVQLARLRGAHVVGVASGANAELVAGLGADEFVDYKLHKSLPDFLAERFGDAPFDHILDCVGTQALYRNSPRYLKKGGLLVNVGAMEGSGAMIWNWLANIWTPAWLGGVPRTYVFFSTPPNMDDAVHLLKLVEEGKIRILVDSVWDMEDARDAYALLGSKRAKGKVVIKVHEP